MKGGFSLVEVVVALALFGFVGLAGAALLESAARSAREAESRERLLWLAGTVLDSLRGLEGWSGGERSLPGEDRVEWTPGAAGGVLEIWPSGAGETPWLVVPVGPGSPGSDE